CREEREVRLVDQRDVACLLDYPHAQFELSLRRSLVSVAVIQSQLVCLGVEADADAPAVSSPGMEQLQVIPLICHLVGAFCDPNPIARWAAGRKITGQSPT